MLKTAAQFGVPSQEGHFQPWYDSQSVRDFHTVSVGWPAGSRAPACRGGGM